MGKNKKLSPVKWFAYLKHRFRARGRHGIHSPFVYSFVEQVLRNKVRFPDLGNKRWLSVREQEALLRTLAFLDIDYVVFLHSSLFDLRETIVQALSPRKMEFENGMPGKPFNRKTFLLADASKISPDELRDIKNKAAAGYALALYLFHVHQADCAYLGAGQLSEWTEYAISLDFWHGFLVYQHQDFKVKQHFLLR